VSGSQGSCFEKPAKARVPLHRRSCGIPRYAEARLILSPRIPDQVRRYLDVADAEFVAVIQRWRAAQGQEQHGRDASLFRSDARRYARPVEIAENPVRPAAVRQSPLIILDQLGDVQSRPGSIQNLEVERQMRAREVLAIIGSY
jgi:hypothetical protein